MPVCASLPGIQLTQEQNGILETCPPPARDGTKGHLVRVTAAAGTGKTTTLLCLALKAVEQGHYNITYLTFTKAAAVDGKKRLMEVLARHSGKRPLIDARTLHSCAFRALLEQERRDRQDVQDSWGNKVWSDKKVKQWISETLSREIDEFLEPCFHELQKKQQKSSGQDGQKAALFRVARDQVEFFIFKTLNQFCMRAMSRQDFGNHSTFGRVYFPAQQFHSLDSKGKCRGERLGFLPHVFINKINWYADQACLLWDKAVDQDILTFNFTMKRAQLLALQVPGTTLLIDESQDMDECQVNWVAEQVKFAKHVYVVGDAAQSIYSFRGAKPEYLMDLAIDEERMLTESWRFGPRIAAIANLVLFAKENSDQTSQVYCRRQRRFKWKNWNPYRVKAGIEKSAEVTSDSMLPKWQSYKDKSEKITLIAQQNKTLFEQALIIMGFAPDMNTREQASAHDKRRSYADDDDNDDFDILDEEDDDMAKANAANVADTSTDNGVTTDSCGGAPISQTTSFPRIHINGYGESSGRKAWQSMFKVIQAIYDLYKLQQDNPCAAMSKLPPSRFPEFAGREVSWTTFCEDVQEREMHKYTVPISLVNTYAGYTMAAVELFQREVIDRNYSVEDADIIFTTCHAAKGLEWTNVEVADDFMNLANYESQGEKRTKRAFEPASNAWNNIEARREWKFGFQAWGDDLNLVYVACTRAKRTLSLPSCVLNAIRDFDVILAWMNKDDASTNSDNSAGDVFLPTIYGLTKAHKKVTPETLEEIGHSLVLKYRKEVQLPHEDSLINYHLNFELQQENGCSPQSVPAS